MNEIQARFIKARFELEIAAQRRVVWLEENGLTKENGHISRKMFTAEPSSELSNAKIALLAWGFEVGLKFAATQGQEAVDTIEELKQAWLNHNRGWSSKIELRLIETMLRLDSKY